jgi:hypothetical protein
MDFFVYLIPELCAGGLLNKYVLPQIEIGIGIGSVIHRMNIEPYRLKQYSNLRETLDCQAFELRPLRDLNSSR